MRDEECGGWLDQVNNGPLCFNGPLFYYNAPLFYYFFITLFHNMVLSNCHIPFHSYFPEASLTVDDTKTSKKSDEISSFSREFCYYCITKCFLFGPPLCYIYSPSQIRYTVHRVHHFTHLTLKLVSGNF